MYIIGRSTLNNIRYADDIVLMADSESKLENFHPTVQANRRKQVKENRNRHQNRKKAQKANEQFEDKNIKQGEKFK